MAKKQPKNITCAACGYDWEPRVKTPKKCPYCQTRDYAKRGK